MTGSDVPPEDTSEAQTKGKSRVDRPTVFGILSIVIGLATGVFGYLLMLSSESHALPWFLVCSSLFWVGGVAVVGLWLAGRNAFGAQEQGSVWGSWLSKVGLYLTAFALAIYLLGWFFYVVAEFG